jgi:hypothetical protein
MESGESSEKPPHMPLPPHISSLGDPRFLPNQPERTHRYLTFDTAKYDFRRCLIDMFTSSRKLGAKGLAIQPAEGFEVRMLAQTRVHL